jgi:hypothetical protein
MENKIPVNAIMREVVAVAPLTIDGIKLLSKVISTLHRITKFKMVRQIHK